MNAFSSHEISKKDAQKWRETEIGVDMVFPKENPPKRRTYLMKRKNLRAFLTRMAKQGAYLFEIT